MIKYTEYLEFFIENGIYLNPSQIKLLKESSIGGDIFSVAKRWWKSPYFISNRCGDFNTLLAFLKDLHVSDKKIITRLSTNTRSLKYTDIPKYIGLREGEYDDRVTDLLKNNKAFAFSDNNDNIEFVSPVNRKLYTFSEDGRVYQIHSLYKFYHTEGNGDFDNEDREDIEWYQRDIGIIR